MRDFRHWLATGRHPKNRTSVVLYDNGCIVGCLVVVAFIVLFAIVYFVIVDVIGPHLPPSAVSINATATAVFEAQNIEYYRGDVTDPDKVTTSQSGTANGTYGSVILCANGSVTFKHILVPKAGSYYVHLHVVNVDLSGTPHTSHSYTITVNGNIATYEPGGTFPLSLNAGENTITVSDSSATTDCSSNFGGIQYLTVNSEEVNPA